MITDYERLVEDIPIVSDRMILESVNGITIARSMGARHNGFFGRLVREVSGRRQRGTDAALAGLAGGQQGLMTWMAELAHQAAVSNLALARALTHVRHMTAMLERVEENSGLLSEHVREVAGVLSSTIEYFDQRMTEYENRMARIELGISAEQTFGTLLSSWASGRRYVGLPWVFQVALLSREMVSGPCGEQDHRTAQPVYRDRLINEILRQPSTKAAIGRPTTIPRLLETAIASLADEQEQLMIAELLDAGLSPDLALPNRPLSATIATSLELSSLPSRSRPQHPAELSLALARRRVGPLDGSTDSASFITQLVREQADSAEEYRGTTLAAS